MYNNRARSRSRNRAEVTPTLFPTAFVPLPPKNDKSRMNEAIAKKKMNPYDQSRAVPNTPSQHQQIRPTTPQRSIAQPVSSTPRTSDPKRDSSQNAMPARSGIQATAAETRVQQPHQSRSVQQKICKSPAPSPSVVGTGNERARPTTPNRPVHYQQQTKHGQNFQQEIPNNITAPLPSIEIVGTGNGNGGVRRPTPTRPSTTTSNVPHNASTRANGAAQFNWAEKNPDEVLGRAKSTLGKQQRVAQMSDLFLDEPDEPPPMDFPESSLHTLSIHSDHPHPPNARKRPHTDNDTDEEPVLEEALGETAGNSLFEEQPQLAQEIDAHFEQAQGREELTRKLQETFISFIAKVNEQKRVAKESMKNQGEKRIFKQIFFGQKLTNSILIINIILNKINIYYCFSQYKLNFNLLKIFYYFPHFKINFPVIIIKMIPAHLTRRQLFSLINRNKANFSMAYNGKLIPFYNKPILKCRNDTTILQDKQLPSDWCGFMRHSSSNSSSILGDLSKKTTIEKEEEEAQTKAVEEATNEETITIGERRELARKVLRYAQFQKVLMVKYKMGKSGRRYVEFNKGIGRTFSDFPKIFVPADVFSFVRAMDEVLNAVEVNKDKIEAQTQTNDWNRQQFVVLHTAKAKGTNKDFELDLCLGQFLNVQMRTVPNESNPEHKPRHTGVPIEIFCRMRQAVGEVFVENGEPEVQQQFGEPPSLPDWVKKVVDSPRGPYY